MNVLINLDVDDLAKAVEFYERATGLRVGRRFEGAVEMLGSTAPIYLLDKAAGSATPNATRTYKRHWTPVHLDFVVEEIEAAVIRATQAGAVLEQPIATHVWGKLAMLADPFGQFLGRGYDELISSSR